MDSIAKSLDLMPAAMIATDRDGRIVAANKRFASDFGCSAKAIIGRALSSVCKAPEGQDGPADDWRPVSVGAGSEQSVRGRMRGQPVRDGARRVVGHVYSLVPEADPDGRDTDVQEPRAVAQRASGGQTSGDRLGMLLNQVPCGVVLLDPDLRVVVANKAFCKFWGVPPSYFEKRPTYTDFTKHLAKLGRYDIAPGKRAAFAAASRRAVFDGTGEPTEIRQASGHILLRRCFALPNGERVLTYDDTTQHKIDETRLAEANRLLQECVAELDTVRAEHEGQIEKALKTVDELHSTRRLVHHAVESISEGFALWDDEDRLVMANSRFRRMFPGVIDVVKPGVPFPTFIRAMIERGTITTTGSIDEEVELRTKRHREDRTVKEIKLADDRWIRVSQRTTENNHIVAIVSDITADKESAERTRQLALEDSLTGLANRKGFQERLDNALANAKRSDRLVGLLFLDLDRFKHVNDALGHDVGDELLVTVAARIKGCCRGSDVVARLGGDEFAVIATNAQKAAGVTKLAERIIAAVEAPFQIQGKEIQTSTSVGITIYPGDDSGAEGLLRNADLALRRAKENGRGGWQLFDRTLHAEAQDLRSIEVDLKAALEEGQFSIVYQPQIDVVQRRIIGAEALLRWMHPERGPVSPADFIPVAEATGLIIPISDWVLREVANQNRAWQMQGHPAICTSVNISPLQFKQANFVDSVQAVLKETGIEPPLLELEITESMAMDDRGNPQAVLTALRALGVGLAIDDFGTGYSSLSRLKNFPVGRLKIDRSFVDGVSANWDDAAISASVIRLGHTLNLKVIAEGVENEEQLAFLLRHGCTEMQGFYFSKPLSAEAFAAFHREFGDVGFGAEIDWVDEGSA